MKLFYSHPHRLHDVPKLGPLVASREFPLEHAYAVHDLALVDFMAGACEGTTWRVLVMPSLFRRFRDHDFRREQQAGNRRGLIRR